MKIALLLTGQLRTWKMTKYLVDNIKQNYDTDVFLSIDKNNNIQNEHKNNHTQSTDADIDEAMKHYNPVDSFISYDYSESDFIKTIQTHKIVYTPTTLNNVNTEKIYRKEEHKIVINTLHSTENCSKTIQYEDTRNYKILAEQYYMVFKAYEMLEKYVLKTSTNYDLVIRLRFDQFIWNNEDIKKYNFEYHNNDITYNEHNISRMMTLTKDSISLKIDEAKENTIYVFGGGCYKYYAYINDQFWVHTPTLNDKMKNFYNELPTIINECKNTFYPNYGCWIEHFFCKYLFQNDITIEKSCVDGVFIRQNK